MKILDIRGNLIKIESEYPVAVSSLLKISDNNQEFLAQVLYTETSNQQNMLFAKVLSLLDNPLATIEVSEISINAMCEPIQTADVVPNFGKKADVVIGEISHENKLATASKNFFDKKLIIVSENSKNVKTLIENYAHQIKNIEKNTVVFDTDGSFEGVKLTAGKDFKLPLNEHAIQFIYDKYFSDITEESKAQIADIFNELKEYAATVPYIPFNTFKAVIDEVFNYSQNISLFFFKTKMEQLHRANVFANTHEEVMNWSSLSEFGPGTLIIDLSKVGKIFISEYISLVVQELNKSQTKIYAFVKLEDSYSDKDFLRELLESSSVVVSYVVKPEFKFLSALKQNCASYIITGDVRKCDNFDYCKFLLKNTSADKYILTGSYIAPMSLIFNLKEITEVVPRAKNLEETEQPVTEAVILPQETEEYVQPEETVEQPETIGNYEPVQEPLSEHPIENVIQDYEPQEIFSVEENSSEETPSTEIEEQLPQNIFAVDEESEEKYPQESSEQEPTTTYEEIEVELPEEEAPQVIGDYVPDVTDTEETANENYEIVDYSPTETETEIDSQEAIEEYQAPITNEEPVLNNEQIFSNDEDESFEILDEEGVFQEPEANVDLENEDLELELSLEEPDAYEPIEDVMNDDESIETSREYSNDSSLSSTEELRFSNQEFSFAEENDETTESLADEHLDKTAEEILDEQIKRDVDRVYMATPKDESEEELSEDDLDFIEELVGADDIIVEESDEIDASDFLAANDATVNVQEEEADEPLIPVRNNTATPAVPIYSAEIPEEAIVQSDPIQQGDRVIHVKFGIGVVEKIFSYGTKNFCSINFENIGRKVLDPNVTELKRA